MRPPGAHTHPDGGDVLALLAVIAAAVVAVPVVDALARLAEVFVITLGVVVGLAVLAGAAVAVARVRHGRVIAATPVASPRPVPWQRTEPLAAPHARAVEAPKQELHLHFQGVDAEDVEAILAERNRSGGSRV